MFCYGSGKLCLSYVCKIDDNIDNLYIESNFKKMIIIKKIINMKKNDQKNKYDKVIKDNVNKISL